MTLLTLKLGHFLCDGITPAYTLYLAFLELLVSLDLINRKGFLRHLGLLPVCCHLYAILCRRGINDTDVVNLSADRRVLSVTLNVKNGVDQIRVLVAADNNLKSQ